MPPGQKLRYPDKCYTPGARAVRKRCRADFFYFVNRLLLQPSLGKGNKICMRRDGPHRRMTDFIETTEKSLVKNPETGKEEPFGTDPRDVTLALAPRGFYKTTIMVVGYALWTLACKPTKRILIVSESGDVAKERLAAIKAHCQNNTDLLTAFPTLAQGKVWTETKIKVEGFTRPGAMECSIRTAGISTKITGQHYDLILGDDIVGPSNTATAAQCIKVRDYYQRLMPILEQGGMTSQLRITGTIWHFADLHCHLLEQALEPDSPIGSLCMSVYDANGDPTWPEYYPTHELEKIRRKMADPQKWANQYENKVIDESDRLISPERWKQFIVDVPLESTLWPAFCAVDPSMGASTDYTAIVTWLMSPARLPYIVDIFQAKVRPEEALRELRARHMKYNYRAIYFEMHDQENLWKPLVELSGDGYRDMPLVAVKRHAPGKTKEVRIRSFGEFLNQGWCRISRACTNLDAFERQVLYFPRIENDDIIDAASEIAARTPAPPRRQADARDMAPSLPPEEMRLLMGKSRSIFLPEWAR